MTPYPNHLPVGDSWHQGRASRVTLMTGGRQWHSALRQRDNKAFCMAGIVPPVAPILENAGPWASGLCLLEPSTAPARLGPLGVWWDFLICISALFPECQIKDRIRVPGSNELPGAQGRLLPSTPTPALKAPSILGLLVPHP